jgi:GntR family transcriptional regulator, transcriptional repressor for pyruvate dehydrogenase complex
MTPHDDPPAEEVPGLRPAWRMRLYEQVERQLRQYMRDAHMKPGDRVPTERDLAAQLAVSRGSVRQAIVSLEVQGLIEVRHGDGMYVRRLDPQLEPITQLLERRRRLPEILEARATLEVSLAALAAERRTDADLLSIWDGIRQMEQEIRDGSLGAEGDAAFHLAVTVAAKNDVLAHLMSVIQAPIEESRLESLSEPGRPQSSLAGHKRIATAIEQSSPRLAANAMRRHIKQTSDVALLRWQPPVDDGAGR